MPLKMLDLFSGIGGFSLAASWTGEIETVAFCEIEKFPQKVLRKHWPTIPIFDDVRTLTREALLERGIERVNIISGGFPCQPFSFAGKQKGKRDVRHLWPQYLRIIQENRPDWVVGENVVGIIGMELDNIISDLEGENYAVQTFIIPACAVDAKHRRDRVWVVANSINGGYRHTFRPINEKTAGLSQENWKERGGSGLPIRTDKMERDRTANRVHDIGTTIPDTDGARIQGSENTRILGKGGKDGQELSIGLHSPERGGQWDVEPNVGRVANGIPNRVDRIKGLGNAIVPQVAYQIFQAIIDTERQYNQN